MIYTSANKHTSSSPVTTTTYNQAISTTTTPQHITSSQSHLLTTNLHEHSNGHCQSCQIVLSNIEENKSHNSQLNTDPNNSLSSITNSDSSVNVTASDDSDHEDSSHESKYQTPVNSSRKRRARKQTPQTVRKSNRSQNN